MFAGCYCSRIFRFENRTSAALVSDLFSIAIVTATIMSFRNVSIFPIESHSTDIFMIGHNEIPIPKPFQLIFRFGFPGIL